jgi:hypothetical protein
VPRPVRVFILTFRRPELLRRALRSLLAQTFTDWTCEVHNDAPEDDTPRSILEELAPGDARFEYRHHTTNWGPVASFNMVFGGGAESLACLLEDDNWWEPFFLQTAVAAMAANPDAALGWTNMRIWQERADGSWVDTGRTIWQTTSPPPIALQPPEILQAFDALHSNGAMIFRPEKFRVRTVPVNTPFAIIEQLRERAATGTYIFIPTLSANFAITQQTARGTDPVDWMQAKLLVAASFFEAVLVDQNTLRAIWTRRRQLVPPDSDIFFQLALVLRNFRLLRFAGVRDWAHFILGTLRHPARFLRALQFRHDHAEVWAWLQQQSRAFGEPARATLVSKQDPLPCHAS